MANMNVKKAEVLQVRREIEDSKGTRIWMDYVNALKLISQVVFTRSSGFVLELVQNAEDAGLGLQRPGVISVSISPTRLKFVHNGRPFDGDNLRSICGIRSSKKPERGTLGYLGIGFKSVFKVADSVEVYSNDFQFKFDRNHEEWIDPSGDTPWHVIPIWLDAPSEIIDSEKTTFIIRFRDNTCFENVMNGLTQLKAELYLFLKWIKEIRFHDEDSAKSWSLENAEEKDGIAVLKQDDQVSRFKMSRCEVIVPENVKCDRLTQEYRRNVNKREIAIAFAVDSKGNLDPSPSTALYGGVYSFLPLGESRSGAKFPIQADFLVQPGRDAINCEAAWNHWLVDEVRQLCIEAIEGFKHHPHWKYQYLTLFDFTKSKGYAAHDQLFGPRLIDPIEKYLDKTPCVVAADGTWARKREVVNLTEDSIAAKALVDLGLFREDEIASIFGKEAGLKLVHPLVAAVQPDKYRKVDRWSLFENEDFLKSRSETLDAPAWFRSLYRWLSDYPHYETSYYRRRRNQSIKGYHQQEIILSADGKLLEGGKVYSTDATISDPVIRRAAIELQEAKPILHADVLGGITEDAERVKLGGFLMGLCGVQKLDIKAVCREAILPRIVTKAPKPSADELVILTRYCRIHLGMEELARDLEIWVFTKADLIRSAKEVLFSIEFRPPQNWEGHREYVRGLEFLSPMYLDESRTDAELKVIRDFFKAVGVKGAPDNGVEEFAINYASEKLQSCFSSVQAVEKRNFGYDLEAQDTLGEIAHIEVKGLSSGGAIELTGNEADVADKYRESFYLCVVSGIPNTPEIHIIKDPASIGKRDKLTILEEDWKAGVEI